MKFTWKTYALALVLVVVAALVLGNCLTQTGAEATTGEGADAPTQTSDVSVSFQAQEDTALEASSGAAYCWVITNYAPWYAANAVGKKAYIFGISDEWCANRAQTKVTKLVYNFCLNDGGYMTFDWCKKEHGATGYESIGMHSWWHYHFVINGLTFTHTPSVQFFLHANGGVTGTVFYDN